MSLESIVADKAIGKLCIECRRYWYLTRRYCWRSCFSLRSSSLRYSRVRKYFLNWNEMARHDVDDTGSRRAE